jgi:hypothetical protein
VPVAGGTIVPVHLADHCVVFTPDWGDAPFQLKSTFGSVRVATGVPDRVMLL